MSRASLPDERPRYSAAPLPPYSYVPGHRPHPVSDLRGHMYGQAHEIPPPLDPGQWADSEEYRRAFDLFSHGYYWESHEAWEGLWLAAGRAGPTGAWLKALIKLAAAGVKAREGNARGVQRHATRSLELIAELRAAGEAADGVFAGADVTQLESLARHWRELALTEFTEPQPQLLLPGWLPLGGK
ncbi:MAG TPA: DUF309 domain-containing protein [Lacipirellulaceae bacterium]|nr:DUF309 domain-containing protein [Lacipirellulaceae bacterium]